MLCMDFVTYQMSLSGKSNPFDVSDITKAVKPPVIEEPEKPTEDSTTALNPSETQSKTKRLQIWMQIIQHRLLQEITHYLYYL